MASDMHVQVNLTKSQTCPRRLKTFVLLLLLAHALIVSATHRHAVNPYESPHRLCLESHEGTGSHDHSKPASDADCTSCVLQRNFIADARIPSFVFELNTEVVIRQTLTFSSPSSNAFSNSSTRAPPLV